MRKLTRQTHVEIIGDYRMRVIKRARRSDDVFDVIFGSVGIAVGMLLPDFGWGPDTTEPRWLVQVRGARVEPARTVYTRFTRFGARRAAKEVREVLSTGDPQVIEALPDLDPRTGFPGGTVQP